MKSNILNQFGDAHLEGAGDSPERSQRNMFLATLDAAHVIRVKLGLFGQLLLAQPRALPLFADSCAKNNTVIRTRPHRTTQPQSSRALYTAKRMIL